MNKPLRISHPLFKIVNNALIDLPTPSNIRRWWNFGSLLGLCLGIQIITGIFLAIHYCPNIELAFNRVNHICRDVNYGWLLRTLHANGASIFYYWGIFFNIQALVYFWISRRIDRKVMHNGPPLHARLSRSGPGFDPRSGQVSWVRFFRGFSSPVRQMSWNFRPPRSPSIIWPS